MELLHYIEHTNEEGLDTSQNSKLHKLKECVAGIRQNAKLSVKYMRAKGKSLDQIAEELEEFVEEIEALLAIREEELF